MQNLNVNSYPKQEVRVKKSSDLYLKGILMFICSAYLHSVSHGACILTNIMSLLVKEG